MAHFSQHLFHCIFIFSYLFIDDHFRAPKGRTRAKNCRKSRELSWIRIYTLESHVGLFTVTTAHSDGEKRV